MNPIVAAIQMTSGMNLQANLDMAQALLTQAAEAGAKLAVLPEMFPLLGMGEEFKKAKQAIQEEPGSGPIQSFLSEQAKQLNMWIVGGTIPLASEHPHKSYAASLVFNHEGKQVARYDKLHLFDATLSTNEAYQESAAMMHGNHITVLDTPIGRIGLAVCYDLRFPELFRAMFSLGAQVFIVPAAFTVPTGKAHWDILLKAIAVQNFAYVVAAGEYGMHGFGRQTYGNSVILNPNGEELTRLVDGIGVITAPIDLDSLHEQRQKILIESHQRIFMDCRNIIIK
ncbi:MAG: carbon-nitrogen hydrolase family protein [Gammaproteobacteria bacterium]